MTLTTYSGLSQAIVAWCNRSPNDGAFVAQIPIFVELAEQMIFQDVSTLGNQLYVNSTFVTNQSFIAKPALWGRTLSLLYIADAQNTIVEVQRVTYEMGQQYRQQYNRAGPPLYYTDLSYNYIVLFPVPDKTYQIQLAYYGKIEPLTPANQTNWLSLNAPDLLFYACMSKAMDYLLNPTESQQFLALYKERAGTYMSYDLSRLLDRTADASTRLLSQSPHTLTGASS